MKVMVLPTQLSPVSGPFVWYGPEMAKRADWIRPLAPAEIAELEAAVQRLDATGIDVAEIGPGHLDVPGLGPLVEQIRRAVLKETGFILVRGVPVDRWSVRQSAIAYFGLGAMIGEPVSQNAKGHILGHVKDIGADYAKPTSRGYQTAARLPYHTDSSDIVALLCLKRSKAGGLSSIASSATIYNEMLKRRSDLAAELTGPVYRDRRGELPEGAEEWYAVPVFSPMPGGGLITTYVRSAMRKAQRFPAVPRTTPELEAACNLFDELAESPRSTSTWNFGCPRWRGRSRARPTAGRRARSASLWPMRPAVQPTYSDAWSRAGSAAGLASRSWSRTGEGARATIGAAAVAQAAPDGHTLIVSNSGSHGISPHIYPNPGYRPLDDFTHIALIALTPHALLVNPAHPGQPLRLPGGCAAGRGDALRGLRHRLLGASARRPPRRGDRPPGRAGAPPRRRPRGDRCDRRRGAGAGR